jgi:hypothetical protein
VDAERVSGLPRRAFPVHAIGSMIPRPLDRPLGAALIALLCACSDSGADPAEAAATPAAGASSAAAVQPALPAAPARQGPSIAFGSTSFDFGVQDETLPGTCLFAFVNDGSETLVVSDVKSTCECVVPTFEARSYAPGERGEISVKWGFKGHGPITNTIDVFSNAVGAPRLALKVSADVQPFVRFEPARYSFKRGPPGAARTGWIQVFCSDPRMRITSIESDSDWFSGRVLPAGSEPQEAGVHSTIELALSSETPLGAHQGVLRYVVEGTPPGADAPRTYEKEMLVRGIVEVGAEPDAGR